MVLYVYKDCFSAVQQQVEHLNLLMETLTARHQHRLHTWVREMISAIDFGLAQRLSGTALRYRLHR